MILSGEEYRRSRKGVWHPRWVRRLFSLESQASPLNMSRSKLDEKTTKTPRKCEEETKKKVHFTLHHVAHNCPGASETFGAAV